MPKEELEDKCNKLFEKRTQSMMDFFEKGKTFEEGKDEETPW